MMRWAPILLLLPTTLTGCAGVSVLGYTTHGLYSDQIRTVAVPIFKNTGFRRDIEFKLTQEVVRELERVGFKVVPSERADVELLGSLSDYAKLGFGLDGFTNPRGGMLMMYANVRYVERQTGRILQEGEIRVDPTTYALQSSDTFLIDVAQSMATAEDRAIKDLAKNIVALLQTPW
jgi:hypothetical protein